MKNRRSLKIQIGGLHIRTLEIGNIILTWTPSSQNLPHSPFRRLIQNQEMLQVRWNCASTYRNYPHQGKLSLRE